MAAMKTWCVESVAAWRSASGELGVMASMKRQIEDQQRRAE